MRLLASSCICALLVACSGPYNDLEASFQSAQPASAPSIPVKRVVLVSTKATGAHSYDGVLSVKLLASSIEMDPAFPFSVSMKPIAIESEQIAGCSKTCFGDGVWDADLLVASTGTEVSFRNSKEIVEWCWANKIPMISANDKRQWLYAGAKLPERTKFSEQLSSREAYDHQARQSCLGY